MSEPRKGKDDSSRGAALLLRSLKRFGEISASDEGLIREAASGFESHPTGSEIIAEGEDLNVARALLSGWAARIRFLSDGRRQIVSFVLPGDVFGIAARPCGKAQCSVVALTPAVIAPLPALSAAIAGPDTATGLGAIAWCILRFDEAFLVNQVTRIGSQTALERMAHLLLEIHHRLREVSLVQGTQFLMPLTQEMLADALGLSVVHTNRTLQLMRRDGLIETNGAAVNILDPERMARIADFNTPTLTPPIKRR